MSSYSNASFTYGTAVTVDTGGQKVLDANPGRDILKIVNEGAVAVTISPFGNPGTNGSPVAIGFSLAAGATYEPVNVPGNAWWASSASATALVFAAQG